jgi:hypothetical protein
MQSPPSSFFDSYSAVSISVFQATLRGFEGFGTTVEFWIQQPESIAALGPGILELAQWVRATAVLPDSLANAATLRGQSAQFGIGTVCDLYPIRRQSVRGELTTGGRLARGRTQPRRRRTADAVAPAGARHLPDRRPSSGPRNGGLEPGVQSGPASTGVCRNFC